LSKTGKASLFIFGRAVLCHFFLQNAMGASLPALATATQVMAG
jgi:hypothetical protein